MSDICVYTKVHVDSYGTHWATTCGQHEYYSAPLGVGWSSVDPLPTERGKFCTHCGEKIVLKERK